jgi:hypothetical protein
MPSKKRLLVKSANSVHQAKLKYGKDVECLTTFHLCPSYDKMKPSLGKRAVSVCKKKFENLVENTGEKTIFNKRLKAS